MSINTVGSIVTDSDLSEEVGDGEFARIAPKTNDGLSARQLTLNDLLSRIKNRAPPVHETDLIELEELRIPCVYGAIARLYRKSMTTGDDVFSVKFKHYMGEYNRRVADLRPTVTGGRIAAPSSIATFRR